MEIQEFHDGYCITHKGEDYKYQGKSDKIVSMVSEKVKELLLIDLELLRKKVLLDNFLS